MKSYASEARAEAISERAAAIQNESGFSETQAELIAIQQIDAEDARASQDNADDGR
jgi:hypothetical protein